VHHSMLQPLCMPALIYLMYFLTHVIVDMYKEQYNKAIIEFFIGCIFTLLLNLLCRQGLGIISWLIVSIPFILMTTIATILLVTFQLNPATGEPLQPTQTTQPTQPTQPGQPAPATQPTPAAPAAQPAQPGQTQPSQYAYPIVAQYSDAPLGFQKNEKQFTLTPTNSLHL